MPPVAAMQIRATAFDGDRLQLHAPLAANVNDKDCAFGGSLASLMTLAGWGLLTLKLQQAGLQADVYVADSQLRYLRPLYADLRGDAALAPDVDWDAVLAGDPGPWLVLGNPPWVTNAELGLLKNSNLPIKSNFQGHKGLEALTGKANFDIS